MGFQWGCAVTQVATAVLLRWPQIQRYLFEGSVLKETKGKGAVHEIRCSLCNAVEECMEHCGTVLVGFRSQTKQLCL